MSNAELDLLWAQLASKIEEEEGDGSGESETANELAAVNQIASKLIARIAKNGHTELAQNLNNQFKMFRELA